MTIKLVRGDGVWKVVGDGVLAESSELAWAAFDALTLAELQGATVELGEGVPRDALELGRQKGRCSRRSDEGRTDRRVRGETQASLSIHDDATDPDTSRSSRQARGEL